MAGEDPEYARWIRGLPCAAPGCMQPRAGCAHHHTGRRGMGQRAHDHETIPLCHRCHMAFHGGCGRFRGWDAARRRQWQDDEVERCRQARLDPECL